jgi:hypothetical protein
MLSRLTVTAAATAWQLTTHDAASAALGSSVDGAQLQRLIAAASAAVGRHLGFTPARETVSETFWLNRRSAPSLSLARTPVATIASVTVDGTALASTDYSVDAGSGLLVRLTADTPVEWLANRVVVAYTGGWLLPGQSGANLPADIERATIVTVAAWAAAQGRDPQLRSEAAEGIGSQSWLDPVAEHGALPWAAAQLLAPWRRYAVT